MQFWAILMYLWTTLAPYLTATNIVAIEAAVDKAIVDYKGGNMRAVLEDLAAALKVILPGASEKIDAILKA